MPTLRAAFLEGLDLPGDTDVTVLKMEEHAHWDSLGHMSLVMSIEERFGVVLDGDEVARLTSYSAACGILQARGVLRHITLGPGAAAPALEVRYHERGEATT